MKKVAIADVRDYNLDNVKKALREMFDELGLPAVNPFQGFVEPGNTVFIKPNWVASRWRESCDHLDRTWRPAVGRFELLLKQVDTYAAGYIAVYALAVYA